MDKLVSCCVSDKEETFIYEIPFVNLVDNRKTSERGTVERACFVADLRNKVMEKALQDYPHLTHVLMIDSYYLDQLKAINRLIRDYKLVNEDNVIIGSSTWAILMNHMRHYIFKQKRFYDFGSSPEARYYSHNTNGFLRVESVGACYIFPIEAWKKNKYNPNKEFFEVEHKSLCRGFNCYLDFNSKLWRDDYSNSFMDKIKYIGSHFK